MLTTAQVAELLGYSLTHLLRLIETGRFPLPVVRMSPKGSIRIPRQAVEEWITGAGRPAAAP